MTKESIQPNFSSREKPRRRDIFWQQLKDMGSVATGKDAHLAAPEVPAHLKQLRLLYTGASHGSGGVSFHFMIPEIGGELIEESIATLFKDVSHNVVRDGSNRIKVTTDAAYHGHFDEILKPLRCGGKYAYLFNQESRFQR